MSHPLPTRDFRALRWVLDPDDFALGSDIEVPPSDLIEEEVWQGIVHLPDDVTIRTSSHCGKQLKTMYELWGGWLEAMGDTHDILFEVMLDATDEFQAVTMNALQGYYRQAIGFLRNALELVTIGCYCQVTKGDSEFQEWQKGLRELHFGQACDSLLSQKTLPSNQNQALVLLLAKKDKTQMGGWGRQLFSNISNYSHSRPQFTDGALWESNGPVFVHEAFELTFDLLLQTYTICYALATIARPVFVAPPRSSELFEAAERPWSAQAEKLGTMLWGKS